MAVSSSSWIKQNMLGSPPKRRMTEAEIRVQRALQRLEIPEWYLNKRSKAPKILQNDTPLDYRQPSWKRGVKSEKISTVRSDEKFTDPTSIYGNIQMVQSSMNESSLSGVYGTPRKFEDSSDEHVLSKNYKICKEEENMERMEVSESSQTSSNPRGIYVSAPKPFYLNKSDSFPKVSPSRKVQNINIVLPPTSKPPPLPLETTWNSDINSNFNSEVNNMCQTFESSFGGKVHPTSCFKTNLANAISPKPFSKKVGTPFMTPDSNYDVRAVSTPDGTQQSLFTSALDQITPPTQPKPEKPVVGSNHLSNSWSSFVSNRAINGSFLENCKDSWSSIVSNGARNYNSLKNCKDSDSLSSFVCSRTRNDNSLKNCHHSGSVSSLVSNPAKNDNSFDRDDIDWKKSMYWIGEVKPFGADCNETCQECGAKSPRIFAAVTKGSSKNFNHMSNQEYLTQKFRKVMRLSGIPVSSSSSSSEEELKQKRTPSPKEKFFNSPKKSTELENIKVQHLQNNQNLVQEIIQELKKKCTINSKKTASVTPGTKHFVKRLVSDLQDGRPVSEFSEEQEQTERDETDADVESGSELELNSRALSTSISFKESDWGSDIMPVSSTLKSNITRRARAKKDLSTRTSKKNRPITWIPIRPEFLSLTGSTMSMMSKRPRSNLNQNNRSPSISPIFDIHQTDEESMKKLLKIEEGGVLDSGYSDRSSSRTRKTDSSMSGDSVSTRTESEKSCSLNLINSRTFRGKKRGVYLL